MGIKSMTGFGRGEREVDSRVFFVEIRCVNNRYLDLKMKLPKGYVVLEDRIRRLVSGRHLRGRIDLVLGIQGERRAVREIRFNRELAEGYEQALRQLSSYFQLELELSVPMLTAFPDVITEEEKKEDLDALWEQLAGVFDDALENCEKMRRHEGKALAKDLFSRLELFAKTLDIIEAQCPQIVEQREALIRERIEKLLDQVPLDPDRLAHEVAILADKSDVNEEIVRLRSHIDQFGHFLEEEGAVGRKLDFLIQEFLREVNTIASKINDASIAHYTVELKSELEKMREQVQNIE